MKVVIAGSRDEDRLPKKEEVFKMLDECFDRLFAKLDCSVTNLPPTIEIFSGKCPTGMDAYGECYAKLKGWTIVPFPADWKRLKLAAGPIRNQQMIDNNPDALICFRFKDSKGSNDVVSRAREKKTVLVIDVVLD